MRYFLISLLLSLLSSNTHAQDLLITEMQNQKIDLLPYTRIYEDKTTALTLDDILHHHSHKFRPVQQRIISHGFSASNFWLKVTLTNNDYRAINALLKVGYPLIDVIELYTIDKNNHWYQKTAGDNLPYYYREIPLPYFYFRLNLPKESKTTYYIKIKTSDVVYIPLTLYTGNAYYQDQYKEWGLGLFYGIVLALFLYNLFIYFSTKIISYFYYILIIFFNSFFMLSLDGLGFILWPESIWWQKIAPYFFVFAGMIAAILFSRSYLDTAMYSPNIDKLLLFYLSIIIISSTSILWLNPQWMAQTATTLALFLPFLLLTASIKRLYDGYRPAKFYVLAWMIMLASIFFSALSALNIILYFDYLPVVHKIATATELILLSFGLADRIKILQLEKFFSKQESETAKAQNQAKSQFLAQISREIRDPIHSNLSIINAYQKIELNPMQQHYLALLENTSQSLLNTINNILDFAKVETGEFNHENTRFELDQIVDECCNLFLSTAYQKKISLFVSIESNIPLELKGHATYLRQLLIHLISNAVKFTNEGEIIIQISNKMITAKQIELYFSIKDTGIGMRPGLVQKLNNTFSHKNLAYIRELSGVGLGLSISQQLIHFMNGHLGVDSDIGKGTNIWFQLKFDRPIHPIKSSKYRLLQEKKLLLIDSNFNYSEMIKEQVSVFQMQMDIAYHCSQAIEMLQKHSYYHFVVIDMNLTYINGIECLQKIQQHLTVNTPILLLSSFEPKAIDSIEHNIYKIISKPATFYGLIKAYLELIGYIDKKPIPTHLSNQQKQGLHILLVEHQMVDQTLIKTALKQWGIETTVVDNGLDAIKLFCQSGKFDLLLIDSQLQKLNAHVVTQHIRLYEKEMNLSQTPIILLHQSDSKPDLSIDFNDSIEKPIKINSLITIVTQWTNIDLPIQNKTLRQDNDKGN